MECIEAGDEETWSSSESDYMKGEGAGLSQPSTHYRTLMSWEPDYPNGDRATWAPLLYAADKIQDKVEALKGEGGG